MTTVHRISDLGIPELAPYRTMRFQEEQRAAGVFVAEGDKVVRRLLESGLETLSIVMPENWLEKIQPLAEEKRAAIPIYLAPRKELEKLTGFSLYQGVMALGRVPPSPALSDLAQRADTSQAVLALEGLTGPDNLGSLLRTAAAFGAAGIVTGETTCSPWLRRAVRASMGEAFKLPIRESGDLTTDLKELKTLGHRVIAAHPRAEGPTLPEADLTGPVCLLLGSEGAGLPHPLLELADECVAVPMAEGVDSLNVSVAGGVFMYEIWRRQAAKNKPPGC